MRLIFLKKYEQILNNAENNDADLIDCNVFFFGGGRGGFGVRGSPQTPQRLVHSPIADLASSLLYGLALKIFRLLYCSSKDKNKLEILQMYTERFLVSICVRTE